MRDLQRDIQWGIVRGLTLFTVFGAILMALCWFVLDGMNH